MGDYKYGSSAYVIFLILILLILAVTPGFYKA